MNIEITNQEGSEIMLKVEGRIDTITAKEFEAKAKSILEEKPSSIIIDCGDLAYVSSSGLRVFLILQKGISAIGGTLRLINMKDAIKQIFKITGFSTFLTIE